VLTMLAKDIETARGSAATITAGWGVKEEAVTIIAEMCYQMGEAGVRKFVNALAALKKKVNASLPLCFSACLLQEYKNAATHMRDSAWRKTQSKDRAEDLCKRMEGLQ
jgi:hypothetical protein